MSCWRPTEKPPPNTQEEIANAGEGTDWFEEITRGRGYIHQQNLSINGGTEKTKYYASLNYFDQEGVVKNSDLTRITGRLNLDQKISDRISFGLSITASQVNNTNVPLGGGFNENAPPLRGAIDFPPIVPVRNEDGEFSRHPLGSLASTLPNPVSLLDIVDETVTERLLSNAFVDVKIIEGLNARMKVGIDKRTGTRDSYIPTTTIFGAQSSGEADKSLNQRNDQLFGLTLTYAKDFGKHSFTLLGGYEYQEFNSEGFNAGNNNFITDGFLYNALFSGVGTRAVGSFKAYDELASYFGRINYNFDNRYLFTASIRADGSPRFGANNRWGYFPSASVAWRIIGEQFMESQNLFSDLKLRVGYGQTGNNTVSGALAVFANTGNS